MNPTRKYRPRCANCGQKLVKNGMEHGKQRWRCLPCGTSRVRCRKDVAARNIAAGNRNYLLTKKTANEAASSLGVSRRTFDRRRYGIPISSASSKVVSAPNCLTVPYLVADATRAGVLTVAIARIPKGVIGWKFAIYESSAVWFSVFSCSPRPCALVSDGQKGIQKAARATWGDIVQQRCHFHVQQNMKVKLTQNPESEAGQDLKRLMQFLSKVDNEEQMFAFVSIFEYLYNLHRYFLNERTYHGDGQNLHRRWSYAHRRVRSAYRQIADLIEKDQLFAYITHPELHLPRTTNEIEGGLNARISELLRVHRGMLPERQRELVDVFLRTKM